MKTGFLLSFSLIHSFLLLSQVKWANADTAFGQLPRSVHVYKTTDSLGGQPNIAYYIEADLSDKKLSFTTDTTSQRRLTPALFYTKNNHPLIVMNCSFFSFATNQSLNLVINNGQLLAYNVHTIPGRGKDTLTYRHPFGSAIGISKKRKADVAWLYTDSSGKRPYDLQKAMPAYKDSVPDINLSRARHLSTMSVAERNSRFLRHKWKMQTAVGGGPVLIQEGEIKISNEEELKFTGKAIHDRHPRTAMGYTREGKLILLVIEGRNPGIAAGATLEQEAGMLKEIGCYEALNLDGGGSSCLLVNGKETIKPSDASGQRPVPAVFVISN